MLRIILYNNLEFFGICNNVFIKDMLINYVMYLVFIKVKFD